MVARQTQERTNARAACRGSAGAQPSFAMPPRPKTHELRAFLPVRTVTRREMCGERAIPLASVGPRADVLGKRACLAAWRARAVAAGRSAFSLHGPARQTFPPAAWHMPRRRRRWRSRVRRFDDTYGCRLGSSVRSSPCKREPGAPWRRRPVAPSLSPRPCNGIRTRARGAVHLGRCGRSRCSACAARAHVARRQYPIGNHALPDRPADDAPTPDIEH